MSLALTTLDPKLPKLVEDPINPSDFVFLAKVVAHKFRKKSRKVEKIEDSEQYSVALLELVRAASIYDSSINEDFSRFAFRAMCNGVIESFRRSRRQKRTAVIEDLSEKEWQDIIAPQPSGDDADVLDLLLADVPEETEQDKSDKMIMRLIYLEGQKVPVVAEKYGITRMTVYNRLRRIMGEIRNRHPDLLEDFGVSQ